MFILLCERVFYCHSGVHLSSEIMLIWKSEEVELEFIFQRPEHYPAKYFANCCSWIVYEKFIHHSSWQFALHEWRGKNGPKYLRDKSSDISVSLIRIRQNSRMGSFACSGDHHACFPSPFRSLNLIHKLFTIHPFSYSSSPRSWVWQENIESLPEICFFLFMSTKIS